jgi:FkbM family methyltransferase
LIATNSDHPSVLVRAWRFLRKPLHEKSLSFYRYWSATFPKTALPIRLPFGAWWLVRNDHVGLLIREGKFERAEVGFVERFIRPGMNVLDIGAHHGFYTLLCSKRTGSQGQVYAFEPSLRERKALLRHVKLNRVRNVSVVALALGNERGQAPLFIVEGKNTGCNSLRPTTEVGMLAPMPVEVSRLDDWMAEHKIKRVDFVKLDVEGGELAVLEGAPALLERRPRPVILAEVQDIRTLPWGYRAKEIINHLIRRGYKWFEPLPDGSLQELDVRSDNFDGNFVAFPDEFADALKEFGRR